MLHSQIHTVVWQVFTNETHPDTLQFETWIERRPDEILDENSPGCTYYPDFGYVMIDTNWFPTLWSAGERLIIKNVGEGEPYGYYGETSGVLTWAGFDMFGEWHLEFLPTPLNIQIEIIGNDVVLTWDDLDISDDGSSTDIFRYDIYKSNNPYNGFTFLDFSQDNTYTHEGIIMDHEKLFYQIRSVVQSGQ